MHECSVQFPHHEYIPLSTVCVCASPPMFVPLVQFTHFCATIDAFSLPVSEIPSDCCCGPPGGALQCFLLLHHLILLKHKADNSPVCVKVSIKMASDSSQLSYYPLSLSRKKPKPRRARFKRCQLLCDSSRLRNIRGEWSPCFGMSAGRLWLPDRLP